MDNERRLDLIWRKNRYGLTDGDQAELDRLQSESIATMQRDFPISDLVMEMSAGMDKFISEIESGTATAKCGRCGVVSALSDTSCHVCGAN